MQINLIGSKGIVQYHERSCDLPSLSFSVHFHDQWRVHNRPQKVNMRALSCPPSPFSTAWPHQCTTHLILNLFIRLIEQTVLSNCRSITIDIYIIIIWRRRDFALLRFHSNWSSGPFDAKSILEETSDVTHVRLSAGKIVRSSVLSFFIGCWWWSPLRWGNGTCYPMMLDASWDATNVDEIRRERKKIVFRLTQKRNC